MFPLIDLKMDIVTMISISDDVLQLSNRCIYTYTNSVEQSFFFLLQDATYSLYKRRKKKEADALPRHGSSIFVHFKRGSFLYHHYHWADKKRREEDVHSKIFLFVEII
jgi:hypothetical protein